MRVIAGQAKGRRLKSVPGEGTRPITDRAKESLFNIIGNDIVGFRFLDLFAGTGQVGIEALSRGAAETVFVEQARPALLTIRDNLHHTRLEAGARVVHADVFEFLARQAEPYEYVYIAPPQYKGLWVQTLRALDANPGWLAEYAWVIVQIDPQEYEEVAGDKAHPEDKKHSLEHLELFDQRTYGGVMFCFYISPPR
ncbi:MAG: 16S rRNA (guanine(966)-N(2))-methyltransferase RsmD [Chloroflexi bacterium]|nr:MAG: 16S rRNA (guanine(966)-N(2))-methyltransferase RsmD [Anaerolineaceae bacterium 4572_32.2]RLC77647.1 MAG: 16S rRNA (guanine(966)-N(2))-methyltransferase RsmD [Chloroflexota bacterium]RLC83630.1 MAG: 16S rRNA (guanine(966)-N(2))-methyltransferase RsmD [Chloroflexota bacterium]HEY72051.1 16S rRNA (guanine(966)-N(2))-methyltransferase RsmD [Thermoflexia bacterium]